jgi:alkanesulfonate monooxygenase SsuD/methylene tetrahydromethanopterin reductase-like flavin-dependent oxidoreductase (luciferase family)
MALNIVNGWFDEEFRIFGGTVLQCEERYRRTIEFIDILRGLWANETFSYEGRFYKVENGKLLLKPASASPPEIYSVSRSDRGRDFIAENCDWWFVDMPKDTQTIDDTIRGIEAAIADMDRRTRRIGRKVRYGFNPFIALGRTQEEALDTVIKRIFACEPNPDVAAALREPRHRAGAVQDAPHRGQYPPHRRRDHCADARGRLVVADRKLKPGLPDRPQERVAPR